MPTYIRTSGVATVQDDVERLVWYSARCTYWTDDWMLLGRSGKSQIPCCPRCGSVGLQVVYRLFDTNAKRYSEESSPGYYGFIQKYKEKCYPNAKEAWKEYQSGAGVSLLNGVIKSIVESEPSTK